MRTEWRVEKVTELVKQRDDQVREAKLKVLFRPLQKLIPFEISENRESEDQGSQRNLRTTRLRTTIKRSKLK